MGVGEVDGERIWSGRGELEMRMEEMGERLGLCELAESRNGGKPANLNLYYKILVRIKIYIIL